MTFADRELMRIEKELREVYSKAADELAEKAQKYFDAFARLDDKKRELVKKGELTEAAYQEWVRSKVATGRHWTNMKLSIAEQMSHVNEMAVDIVNGHLPKIYAFTYDEVGEGVEKLGISWEMADEHTVTALARGKKTLLPYKYIDGKKDVRWNTKIVNSEVMQAIVQGESVRKLADRMYNVTEMDRVAAMRNARTSVTSAENKGRIDGLHDAKKKGVSTKKGWLAALDNVTRDSHRELSTEGKFIDIDEKFSNGLLYPGDPNGRPEEVYNCRCTLIYELEADGETVESEDIEPAEVEAAVESVEAEAKAEEPEAAPIQLPDKLFNTKQSKELEKYLNDVDGRDPEVAELFGTMGDKAAEQKYPIKVSYMADKHAVETREYLSGGIHDVQVKIPKMNGDADADTTIHELGHLLDQLYGGNRYVSAGDKALQDAIANGRPMSTSTKTLLAKLKQNGDNVYDEAMKSVRAANSDYNSQISALFRQREYDKIKALQKQRDKAWKEGVALAERSMRAEHKGYDALEDIYDAITGGELHSQGYYGHGRKYYSSASDRAAETFANYCSLSQVHPEILDVLRKEQPEIYDACRSMVKLMLGR